MKQILIILRGAPCSGKTTLGEKLRDYPKRITWLSVDKVKPIFSDFKDETLDEANKTAMIVLNNLFERDFSVVMEGIFKKPEHLEVAIKIANDKDVPVIIYQLECSLETLKKRDKNRDGVKQGLWKPLGDELIESLYQTIEQNPIEGVIKLNTEDMSLEQCVEIIKMNFPQNPY